LECSITVAKHHSHRLSTDTGRKAAETKFVIHEQVEFPVLVEICRRTNVRKASLIYRRPKAAVAIAQQDHHPGRGSDRHIRPVITVEVSYDDSARSACVIDIGLKRAIAVPDEYAYTYLIADEQIGLTIGI
jgi:hypothetical protein